MHSLGFRIDHGNSQHIRAQILTNLLVDFLQAIFFGADFNDEFRAGWPISIRSCPLWNSLVTVERHIRISTESGSR